MINIKKLRKVLETHIILEDKLYKDSEGRIVPWPSLGKRITIKRKKKMVLEQNSNGKVKTKRKNVIYVEIIE